VAFLSAADSLVVQDPVPPCLEGYLGWEREGCGGEYATEEKVPTQVRGELSGSQGSY
jgi:hypothetical protein